MKPIQSPITPGDTGDAVANVQAGLAFLIDRGLFITRDPPNLPTVDDLARLRKDLDTERAGGRFGRVTRRLVLFWQLQSGLGDSRDGVVDAETADSLNATLKANGAFDQPGPGDGYLVTGRILGRDGAGQARLVVQALDRDLRLSSALGDAVSDAEGRYEIFYRREQFATGDGPPVAPDLFIRVTTPPRRGRPGQVLGESPVRMNATRFETIDLVLTDRGESEFARIERLVTPLLAGQGQTDGAVRDLTLEELTPDDAGFLSRETGLGTDLVIDFILAAALRREALALIQARDGDMFAGALKVLQTRDALVFFYAAIRAGAAPLSALLGGGRSRWKEIVTESLARGRIDPLDSADALFDALDLCVRVIDLDPARSSAPPVAFALSLTDLQAPVAFEVMEIARAGVATPDDFLPLGKTHPEAEAGVNRLVRTLRLTALTGGDQMLTRMFLDKMPGTGHDLAPLAEWSTKDFAGLVAGAGGSGDSDAVMVRAFALQGAVESAHPIEALGHRVQQEAGLFEAIGLKDGSSLVSNHADAIGKVLANPAAADPAKIDGLTETQGTVLVQIGLYATSGLTYGAAARMIEKGFTSPAKVAGFGPDVFEYLHVQGLPKGLSNNFAYDMAQKFREGFLIANELTIIGTSIGVLGNVGFGNRLQDAAPPSPPQLENAPTVAGIFGTLDECLCRPCESVIGLPAYLVDLLTQLKTVPAIRPAGVSASTPFTAQDVLRAQRPDIFSLPLTCAMADEELSHIELAVEAMERRLTTVGRITVPAPVTPAAVAAAAESAPAAAGFPWILPYDGARDRANAYLKRLNVDRAALLGLTRGRRADELAAARLGIAAPISGIATSEWRRIIDTATSPAVWALYGLQVASSTASISVRDPVTGTTRTGAPGEILRRLSILLDRTGLVLEDLQRIIRCASVWPQTANPLQIMFDQPDHPCKISEMTLSSADPALFDRLHRFVRLSRLLPGWTVEELDSALLALAPAPVNALDLSEDKLVILASIARICGASGIRPASVLALCASARAVRPGDSAGTLFDTVFLAPAITGPVRSVFAALAAGSAVPTASPAWTMSRLLPAIASAMGADSRDLAPFVPASGGETVTLAGLAWFHRRHLLAGALGVSLAEVPMLLDLFGVDLAGPSAGLTEAKAWFARLLQLVETAPALIGAGLSPTLVHRLAVAQTPLATGALAPGLKSDAEIAEALQALRVAVASIPDSAPLPTASLPRGDAETRLRAALTQVLPPKAVQDAVAGLLRWFAATPDVALAGPARTALSTPFGTPPSPLFTASEAASLIDPAPTATDTMNARIGQIADRCAERLRENAAIEAISRWTRRAAPDGAAAVWPPDLIAGLAGGRLTLEPASGSTQPRSALGLIATAAFRGGTLPSADQTALTLWTRRVDLVLATLPDLAGAEWLGLPGLDWRAFLQHPASASAQRLRLVHLLLAGAPDRLGLPALGQILAASDLPGAAEAIDARLGAGANALAGVATGATVTLAALRDPETLHALVGLAAEARRLTASAAEIEALLDGDLGRVAATARLLLTSRLDPETLAEAEATARGQMLARRRDALLGWLVANDPEMVDAGRVHEILLIDPEMSPCFKTTRILAAIGATQLFIQRFLFGLEQSRIAPRGELDTQRFRARFEWMKSYRLWEANRKVFLFPENWLFPKLRDDKSDAFRQLEADLGKGELTADIADEAFGTFLEAVAEAGQIQVVGMFEDVEGSTTQPATVLRRDLYLVGRTPNPPYRFFWRVCRDFGQRVMEWHPWRRLELDITSDHVSPFMLGGRLNLVWPKMVKTESKDASGNDLWRIDLGWAALGASGWRDISTSRAEAYGTAAPNLLALPAFAGDERVGITIRPEVAEDQRKAKIKVYLQTEIKGTRQKVEQKHAGEPSDVGIPERFLRLEGFDEVKRLIKANFDKLADGNKVLFYAYALSRIAKPGGLSGLPSQNPGDITTLVSAPFALLQFGDFRRVRDVYDFDKRDGNVINIVAQIFGNASASPQRQANVPLRDALIDAFLDHQRDIRSFNGQTYSSYRTVFQELLHGYSVRKVTVRAWLRTNLSGVVGDVELLSGRDGTFNLVTGTGATQTLQLDPDDTFTQDSFDGIDAVTLQVRWPGRNLVSDTANLEAVSRGKQLTHAVDLVIDETASSSGSGVVTQQSRKFQNAVEFSLAPGQQIQISKPPTNDGIKLPFDEGVVYSNGFHEPVRKVEVSELILQEINDKGLTFTDRQPQRTVFANSVMAHLFWVVGAGRTGEDAQFADVWSYREGTGKCLIDRGPGSSGLAIYPDGWYDEQNVLREWGINRRLPGPEAQRDSFGVALLPNSTAVAHDLQVGRLAYDRRLPYALTNWEVFLHAPLLIADQLSQQQRFEEADRWLRMIFDPTSVEPGATAARFMRFAPFSRLIGDEGLRNSLELLARMRAGEAPTGSDTGAAITDLIERWRDEPYRPFAIARRREVAFLWATLFAYVDNLVAWADSLFRRDTRETIGEATMLYGLVARILGKRPRRSDKLPARPSRSYDDLSDLWDRFGNAWLAAPRPTRAYWSPKDFGEAAPTPGALYFCLPFNDKLTGYWDIVEDRLFKIRHCRNIEGVERTLPFTDPPIDPELLVRATSAGLDIGSVVAGLFAPPPQQRFVVLMSRAGELANEVRSLGGALLAALEKRDAEALGLMRSGQEVDMLQRVRALRRQQIEEAGASVEALRASRRSLEARYRHLMRLMGQVDAVAPAEGTRAASVAMLGRAGTSLVSGVSNLGLIAEENDQYIGIDAASTWGLASGISKTAAGVFFTISAVPTLKDVFTGFGQASNAFGDAFGTVSTGLRNFAERSGMQAGHIRRRDDWAFQTNQTLKELEQIDKQILAGEIRKAINVTELANHDRQITHAEEVADYLRSKFSNTELYDWMASELSALHSRAYRMALDLARQAERAAVRELGIPPRDLAVIASNHVDAGRAGLLAGERLYQDLKRLEVAYHSRNRREHEMVKHVSLRLLDGNALARLKLEGKCTIKLPEWLFDMDMPGHFGRRLKAVSLSIPCVTGPYASVNCKLTLTRSDIRLSPTAQPQYVRSGEEDMRFATSYGPIESIVTSSGRDDSGLFEVNLRDDRFLPFEHAGAISEWTLELPNAPPNFDHDTISDVILHLRYTARSDDILATAARDSLRSAQTNQTIKAGLLVSLRTESPAEWAVAKAGTGTLSVPIDDRFLPYAFRRAGLAITQISALRLVQRSGALVAEADWAEVRSTAGTVTVSDIDEIEDCLVAIRIGGT
jgi:hypothetical protein